MESTETNRKMEVDKGRDLDEGKIEESSIFLWSISQ